MAGRLGGWLREERVAVALVAGAGLAAFVVWGGSTRVMEDTGDYRLAAQILRSGWHTMPDRALGYPVLLLVTGADREGTALLAALQLAVHAVAVLVTVDIARRIGVGPRGRVAVAALLVAPPVLQLAIYVSTEVWAELGVVGIVWLLVRWVDDRRPAWLLAAGTGVGLLTLVRPTYQLLVIPLAAVVGLVTRRRAPLGAAVREAATLALPAVVLIGALVVVNAVRFDRPAVDRLLPYHLSEKTALVVEDLPASDEPARSMLVAERDRLLVEDGEHSAAAFLFNRRVELEQATGLRDADLDRWVLERDLRLIREHPLSYVASVQDAAQSYVQVDARNSSDGGRVWLGGVWHLLHLGVAAAFVAVSVVVPGVALTRGMDRRQRFGRALCWLVVGYTALVTVLLVNGEPRTRAPTDALIVLLLVSGVSYLRRQSLARPFPGR